MLMNMTTSKIEEMLTYYRVTKKDQFLQFSKTPILANFGELPFGEIPEPLKYERPFHMTTLSNGIRVCTE